MKTMNRILSAATVVAAFMLINQAAVRADDGIAASPKVRQMLDQQKSASAVAVAPAKMTCCGAKCTSAGDTLAVSPKVRALLAEQKRSTAPSTEGTAAGYQPVGADGIAASPKLREQLKENEARFQIAPIK